MLFLLAFQLRANIRFAFAVADLVLDQIGELGLDRAFARSAAYPASPANRP